MLKHPTDNLVRRSGIMVVKGENAPENQLQVQGFDYLQKSRSEKPVGRAKELQFSASGFMNGFRHSAYFVFVFANRFEDKSPVAITMPPNGMPGCDSASNDVGIFSHPFPYYKKTGERLEILENCQNLFGVVRMRTVVKGEKNGIGEGGILA